MAARSSQSEVREDEVPASSACTSGCSRRRDRSPGPWDVERRAALAMRRGDRVATAWSWSPTTTATWSGFCTATRTCTRCAYGYRCWVEDLAVDPERRSEGIGKALLDAAKAWGAGARRDPPRARQRRGSTDAHRFYDREAPAWSGYRHLRLLERRPFVPRSNPCAPSLTRREGAMAVAAWPTAQLPRR